MQFYADNHAEESSSNKDSGVEIIKFFLNCLSLLLGRLDDKKFRTAMTDFGSQISQVLMSQVALCISLFGHLYSFTFSSFEGFGKSFPI